MDYHLQNLRTGETLKLHPERTLIGTAEHATVRTSAGPYLAALAVRLPGGWMIFGLGDDESVTYNRQPFLAGQRMIPKRGDLLMVGEEKFTLLRPGNPAESLPPAHALPPEGSFAYIQYPDGKDECRALDHDLLFGRLSYCHVQLADTRLSRLNALLAWCQGEWYVHNLTKKVIGKNRKPVAHFSPVYDGDELLIGPLTVRLEIRQPGDIAAPTPLPAESFLAPSSSVRSWELPTGPGLGTATDINDATDDGSGETPALPNMVLLRANAQRFDNWLKAQHPQPAEAKGGLAGWFGSQRDWLRRFWYDTPETTTARNLRHAGRPEEAFHVLERAIRARPNSPDLLRELYHLYEAVGFHDLCYRPLRQIEKLAGDRPDPWVLERLAHLCEQLSLDQPTMLERAIDYWTKLEKATGTTRTREKNNVLARRALRDRGLSGANSGNDSGF
ncbi:MAG: FHA domain-containing protein [Gemmataceae bacterium]|nr:hypothetical protein [Gemmata sp.]MDW8196997.1 FHA domain-containing protein [Gemmataceae bacterium]